MKPYNSSTQFSTNAKTPKIPIWCAGAFTAALLAVSSGNAFAGLARPFTPGDIVVERFGDNSAPLTSAGTAIFLDEMTTSGTLVQSIEILTNGPGALVDVGNSGGDIAGGLSLSANGQYVVFPGYSTNSGTPSISGTGAPRGIGQVDANGNYILPVTSTTAFTGSTIRGAASDGLGNYWGSGTSGNTSGGIQYFGTTASAVQVYTNGVNANLRCCGIFNGNLWFDTASSTALGYGVYQFSGLPTTVSQPTKIIPLVSTYASLNFSVSPDGNTIYVADDGFESLGATNSGIHKWTFNGSSWSQAYLLISNTPCYGITVDYLTTPATIYATSGAGTTNNSVIQLQDNGATSIATTNVTCATNEMYRGLAFVPTNVTVVTQAPSISAIYPTNETIITGSTATFNLFGDTGNPVGSIRWYQGSTSNQVAGQTGGSLVLANATAGESGKYFAVVSNVEGVVTSSVVTLLVTAAPTITGISPTSVSVNAGQKVTFTITSTPGSPPASNLWYRVIGTTTNLISNGSQSSGSVASGATTTSLTLSGVLGGDTASYFAVLTNIFGSATSAVATLTINNDPIIQIQPRDSYGLVDGTVQFSVTGFGTSPSYQWYFANASGNIIAPVPAGNDFGDQAVVSGVNSSLLTISDVQYADLTNFVVVISDIYGSQTSSVVSLLDVTNVYYVDDQTPYNSLPPVTPIALWDFNGPEFTNTAINPSSIADPSPYIGVGTASPVGSCNDPGTSPFSGSADPADGPEFDSIIPIRGDHLPNFSWGTDNYPASGSNKMNGVQFNVSTLGAKNILLSYDSRVSATASDYERVQYTTNGSDWIDYPSSSTFGGIGTTYITYTNDFSGFPNVANNPNFGVRIVTEAQFSATYGISGSANTNAYFGTANTYGTAGTVTYDLVGIYGDAITNNNVAPTISPFMDTNTIDSTPITIPFTVSGDTTANQFTYSALSLNPSTVNPTFNFTSNALGNCTLTITPNVIQQPEAAAPILVSVTDTNGDVTKAWFLLTVVSANLPPTNSLTQLAETNTIANTTLAIPFLVGSASNNVSQFTYNTGSGNNTVVPAQNIAVSGVGTVNPTVTIAPGSNELGMATVIVTVNDNNAHEPKSTTANVPFMVRPNTNVLFVDYFNYDQSGFLDQVSTYWQHLTGNFHTMALNSSPTGGYVLVDTANDTENMEVPLLGAPYSTNTAAAVNTLYYSMSINLNNPSDMPNSNGTYFAALNDGLPSATADVEALLMITTNDVAPGDFGDYQVGIADQVGATASSPSTVMFPQDLVPGNNYNVVVGLNLSNGVSTVWVNPSSESSPSVTSDNSTIVYNISDFELRQSGNESGDIAGAISVSYLKVGTTFDSVFPTLHVLPSVNNNVIVNWSDPTLGIQSTTNLLLPFTDIPSAQPPYTYSTTTNSAVFFRFGR